MTGPIKRDAIDLAVQALLVKYVQGGLPTGLVSVPPEATAEKPVRRYAIVMPVEGSEMFGADWTDPEGGAHLLYRIRSHGRDRRQAQFVMDEVRRVMTGRDAFGALVYALDLANSDGIVQHGEHDRSLSGGLGAVTLLANVWQGSEEFSVTVSRTE